MKVELIKNENGRLRITAYKEKEADIKIKLFFNSKYVKETDKPILNAKYFANLSTQEINIEVVEGGDRPLSGFPEFVNVVMTFISLRILEGFLSGIGSDIYKKLLEKCKEIVSVTKNRDGKIMKDGIQVIFSKKIDEQDIKIKVAIQIDDFSKLGKEQLTFNSINHFVEKVFKDIKFSEVLIDKTDEYPYWKVIHYIADNKYYRVN